MTWLCGSVFVPASQIPILVTALGIHYFKSSCPKNKQKQPPEVFYKNGVLRNLAKFRGKHLCQSLLFNKVAGLSPATLLKKRLWHKCFLVNFAKFLRTPFLHRIPPVDCFWTNLHEPFKTVTFHHDAPNSHVPGINFLEFLVHALSIASYHSWKWIRKVCLSIPYCIC